MLENIDRTQLVLASGEKDITLLEKRPPNSCLLVSELHSLPIHYLPLISSY